MTGQEAFARAMRIKLQRNREARAASKASEKSDQSSAPSETPAGPVSAEELDQAILDDLPKLPNPIPVLIDEHHTVSAYTLIYADPEFTPPFPCWPPHTAWDKMVASLNRGENFHGNLTDEFYVTANMPDDAGSHLVLWMGDDGSQNNDDRPHLIAVAYAALDHFQHFWEYDDWEYGDNDRLASAVLLCAWIRAAREAWGDDYYETDTDCCGGEMPDGLVEELLRLACSKDALRLNRNGRPWAALRASGKSASQSEPSETPAVREPPTSDEMDQLILDRHPELTKEELRRIAQST
jgi:hypothetical protein